MNFKAIIEIPKGSDRRIHMRSDGSGFEDFGPIKEKISINDGVMPVAYGFIEEVINPIEKDNVDVIVFSNKKYETGDRVKVGVIGLLNREDVDHKVIATDDSVAYKSFSEVPLQDRNLILDYFSHTHQITIEDATKALEYLDECMAA
ncbi:MAG: inorganic diphosphatase [Candidatus Woesebacteria bacterium]|nr:inorganic diphosphatase [Candidatus Woesebacteria bacterium]